MTEKRKDSKGRVLRQGESQRNDGTYQFRFTDHRGKRRYVYAATLVELRQKEDCITRDRLDGISGMFETLTVEQLVEKHINLRHRIRESTKGTYYSQLKIIQKHSLASMLVYKVKRTDVIQFCIDSYEDGIGSNTITNVKVLLRSSFQDAVEDDLIRKNPANFKVSDYIGSTEKKVKALTKSEVERLLQFVAQSTVYKDYYDVLVILLETGLRASEFCGLTKSNIDFGNRQICVDHQLRRGKGKIYISPPKTDAGTRFIPLTDKAVESFRRLIKKRDSLRTTEYIVDGLSGFLFISHCGKPKASDELYSLIHRLETAYNKVATTPIRITPHVFRHTFCTMLSNAGVSPKTLKYLMGHGDLQTLKIYDDVQYDVVKCEFMQIIAVGM